MDSEGFRAQILETYITKIGLTAPLVQQLEGILEKQFQVTHNKEIKGSIFFRDKKLELEVLSSSLEEEVEEALLSFSKGDDNKVDLLYDYSLQALQTHTEYHGEKEMLKVVHYFFEVFRNKSPLQRQKFSTEGRKKWSDLYREIILGNYSDFSLREMKIDEKGFIGLFHVHDEGTPPSPLDLASNQKIEIPSLVIAGTEDYKASGITIYLVAKGDYKVLYQGSLQPKQEK